MALFIVGSYKASPYDPDSAFDPVTHIATEASFIQLLQHGVYDSKYIGYKVQLGNSVDYDGGLWVIADVNHDSTNTGQSNCYDLVSQEAFYNLAFNNTSWRDSSPRSYLNLKFYNGLSSNFKAHMISPKYKSQYSWYTDDKIILLSDKEVGIITSQEWDEGTQYPIFTNSDSRTKYQEGTQNRVTWWTRTVGYSDPSYIIAIGMWGTSGVIEYYNSAYLAPLMRVH